MTITASPLVASTAVPLPSDLWEPSFFFFHNWRNALSESAAWRTVIEPSRSDAEQRFGQVDKPYRSQTSFINSFLGNDALRLQSQQYRLGRARKPEPLHADQVSLTGRKTPLSNIYLGDFTDRRFYVGGWAVAAQRTRAGFSDNFKHRKIVAVTATELTLDGDLLETYSAPIVFSSGSSSTTGLGTTMTSSSFVLAADQSICCFVSWKGTGTSTVSQVSLRSLETGYSVVISGDLTLDQASKAITGSNIRMAVIAGMPPQDSRLVGTVVVDWVVSTGSNGPVHFHNIVLSGAHRIVRTLSTWNDTTAGTSPVNSLAVSATMVNSMMIAMHTATAASGIFASSSDTFISAQNDAGLQTFVQRSTTVATGADTLTATHNNSPATEGLMALAAEIAPVERNGLDREDVFPCIEADLSFASTNLGITDTVIEGTVDASETAGVSALDPLTAPGTLPSWAPTSGGYPVLTLPIDWQQVQTTKVRTGERSAAGITQQVEIFGSRPGESFQLSFTFSDRQSAMRLLGFFDSRAGRAYPFWIPAPAPYLMPTSAAGTSVEIPADIPDRDWELFGHIAIKTAAGVWSIHQITGSTVFAGTRTLTVTPAVPGNASDEYRIAHLVRFDSDNLSYSWTTTTVLNATVLAVELLEEKSVSISLTAIVGPGGGCTSWAPDNALDLCKCKNKRCGVTDPGGCCVCGLDPLVIKTWCYVPTEECGPACTPTQTCAGSIPYVSCTAGVARWEQGGFWVELDTNTGEWTYDLGTLITVWECCAEVTGDEGLCSVWPGCIGIPVERVTSDCTTYLVEQLCDRLAENSNCTFVPVIYFKIKDGGPGEARCAGL